MSRPLPIALLSPLLILAHLPVAYAQPASEIDTTRTLVVTSDRLTDVAPQSYRAQRSSLASGQPVSFLEEARTVETVTAQVVTDHNINSLSEAMTMVAGVTEGNNMGGTEDGFIKRGFGSNSDGSILIDGIRQPRGTFSMATVDRVEVLKGPASLFQGQQDPGGVINLITKRPEYHWQRQISAESSSFGGGSGSVDVTGPVADTGLAFRFIAHHENKDSSRAFGSNRRTTIAPSLRWEGSNNRAQIAYEYRDYDLDLDRGTVMIAGEPAKVPSDRRFDEPWSRVFGHDEALTGWWEQDLNDHWSTRLTYGWNRRQYSDGQPRVMGVNEATGALTRRADANHGFDRRVQYAAWNTTGTITLADMRHDLTVEVDHERQRDFLADVYRGKTVADQNIYAMQYGGLNVDSDSLNSSRSNRLDEINTTGVYLNDRWHFNERWVLGLGGRYTHYEQFGGRGQDFITETDISDDIFLPSVSLLHRLTPETSLYASYSEAFVPNGTDSDTGHTLEPEHSKGSEIGVKHLWNDQLAMAITLFDIRKNNVAVSDNGITRTVGEAGSQGVELTVSGQLTERLSLLGAYAYTDTEVLKDTASTQGNRLSNAARHTASLYVAHDLMTQPTLGDWRIGGGVRYVGDREGDANNSFQLDAYTVADAFIGWDTPWLDDNLHLQLNAKNLFDTTYYPSSGGSTRVVVGSPLEFSVQASMSF